MQISYQNLWFSNGFVYIKKIYWALWSLIVFDPDDNPIQNDIDVVFEREKTVLSHFVFFFDNSEIPAIPWT